MPSLPGHLKMPSRATKLKTLCLSSLNFYRVHLITFTIVPLISSAIMWATSTTYHIPYIDCLFVCMSALTVTGLATINLSTLSPFQQVIVFIQMCIGSPITVSIIMIIVRRHFFRQKFKHVIQENHQKKSSFNLGRSISRVAPTGQPLSAIRKRFSTAFAQDDVEPPRKEEPDAPAVTPDEQTPTPSYVNMKPVAPLQPSTMKTPKEKSKAKKRGNISVGMIKRVEGGGVGLMNPMGWYDAERADVTPTKTPNPTPETRRAELSDDGVLFTESPDESGHTTPRQQSILGLQLDTGAADDRFDGLQIMTDSPPRMNSEEEAAPNKMPYAGMRLSDDAFPRSRTIAFEDGGIDDNFDHPRGISTGRESGLPRSTTFRGQPEAHVPRSTTSASFPRTYSLRPVSGGRPDTRFSGFGGFPTPLEILRSAVDKAFPQTSRSLTKTLTMPRTATFNGRSAPQGNKGKDVSYISFAATVGRNSRFTGLTADQMDELGGVEYRALKVLLYIVIGYVLFLPLAGFVIIAPYTDYHGRYDYVFNGQYRLVRIPWFALFQSVSAFSNTGMSLVDTSMIPFQRAYLMIFVMFFLIFAGNTAFPVLLRSTVYVIWKLVPKGSRVKETLKFLLDHPRRCYIYLFPSTQTWVLALVMTGLTLTDWVSFLVLDIGTPVIQALPVGTRISVALLQSAAVRAAGFAIVPIANLAPAVKVLYTIMMYISVYPVALSVRSTNVYEERSLGLFHEDEDEEDDDYQSTEVGAQAVAKYLGWHARRQLAFDIWWLGFALWLICIIERTHLDNVQDSSWFDVFSLIFELVSGYGTCGLSLGLPYDNYSLCGGMRKLSKLVLVGVMLRGRHRGLPVAIDRAVMLPRDFTAAEEAALDETRSRRTSRRGSTGVSDEILGSLRRGSPDVTNQPIKRDSSDLGPFPRSSQKDSGLSAAAARHGRQESVDGSTGAPSSPATISFSLPRGSSERQRSPIAYRSGMLTPVRETGTSRDSSRMQ